MTNFTPSQDRDLVELLTEARITSVLAHFAEATGVASGMVRWNLELENLASRDISTLTPHLGKQYEHLRLSPVVNERPLCKALRDTPVGNTHCFFSDGRYCHEAHRRGIPIAYRCHAGLVDVVCPVYVGTYHEANVYGGQIVLLDGEDEGDLRKHEELAPFVTQHTDDLTRCLPVLHEATDTMPILCDCFQGLPMQTVQALAQQAIRKTPRDLLHCIRLLQDIAGLLSREATDAARTRILDAAEQSMSGIAAVEDGIAKYLEAASKLVSFKCGIVIYRDRERGVWQAIPYQLSARQAELLGREEIARGIDEATDIEHVDRLIAQHVSPVLRDTGCEFFDCVPMHVTGRCVGAWVAGFKAPRSLREQSRRLLLTFASRAGSFIEAAGEFNTLSLVQHDVASMAIHPDEEELPQAVTEGAKRLYGSAGPVGLWILNQALRIVDHFDLPRDPFNCTAPIRMTAADGSPTSLSGQAILEQRAVWEQDIATSTRHCFPQIAAEHKLKAVLCVPLFAGRRAVGVLNIHQTDAIEPNIHEKARLEAYGRSAAHAVQTWQLGQVNQQLDGCQCLRDIEIQLEKHAARLTGARMGCLWLYRERPSTYVLAAVWGADRDDFERQRPSDLSLIVRHIRERREPLYVGDTSRGGVSEVVRQRHGEIKAWIALPLHQGIKKEGQQQRFIGILFLYFDEKKSPDWPKADELFLGSYAAHLATALHRVVAEKDLRSTSVLARDDLLAAAARYANTTHLATIDEVAHGLMADHPEDAKRLQRCVGAIRHGAPWRRDEVELLPPVGLGLRSMVERRWQEAVKISNKEYVTPKYAPDPFTPDEFWPATELVWPQAYLVRVLDTVFVNTIVAIDHAIEMREISLDKVQIHVFAYDWEQDIQLTVWCNCAPFRPEDIFDVERDQLPKSPRDWGGGLRVAAAILHRAGGNLHIRNAEGALIRLVIPKRWSETM
jgi:GAF domain-containing protein